MIGWLRGEVIARDVTVPSLLVNAGGVGYEVHVDVQTLASMPPDGGEATLWIHTHVKEDILALYGFTSREARSLFQLLLTVPRVGPRAALAALGGFSMAELVDVLASGDVKRMRRVQGIGPKLASQIMVSISEPVQRRFVPAGGGHAGPGAPLSGMMESAQETLVAWGFKAKEVERALTQVDAEAGEQLELEELLRRAAQRITSGD